MRSYILNVLYLHIYWSVLYKAVKGVVNIALYSINIINNKKKIKYYYYYH